MDEFKVSVDPTKKIYTFRFKNKICRCCGQSTVRRSIRVTYKTPYKPMTIFEGELIAYVVHNILSGDIPFYVYRCPINEYANCQAGKEWLENIEKVEFL